MMYLPLEKIIKHIIKSKEDIKVSVDMTAGNGNDTYFLSGVSKKVYAFDIQDIAINKTNQMLTDNEITNVELIKDTHTKVDDYVKEADVIVFNLGYLPNGDKRITTSADGTMNAIRKSLELLCSGGMLLVTCYRGHKEGLKELEEVKKLLKTLKSSEFEVVCFEPFNKVDPPTLFIVAKQ